jgi:ABC-type dipeptide/oligopeptide/nickel transport system permease subunit
MKAVRAVALAFLIVVGSAALLANVLARAPYAEQFRELPNAPPSVQHWLGTDEVGRDRYSRLLYGTRISLLLAPLAALSTTMLAALIGGVAGYLGGCIEIAVMWTIDLFLSLPWLFLLVAVRALLPLNASPELSVMITFGMLGVLGWAGAARVIATSSRSARDSDFILLARASGVRPVRLFARHILPNLTPGLLAQFWISIPVFILAEANLGVLGLGVAEPLPSWGSLLRELENYPAIASQPWLLIPLLLLVAVVTCFQIVLPKAELPA